MNFRFHLLKRINESLSKKILVSVLIVSSIITTLITAVQIYYDYETQVQAISQTFKMIEKSYLNQLKQSLWDYDETQVMIQLESILTIPNITSVEVKQGDQIFQKSNHLSDLYTTSQNYPLIFQFQGKQNHIGDLKVTATLDLVRQNILNKLLITFFLQFLKTLAVSMLILLFLRKILLNRLLSMQKTVAQLTPDSIAVSLPIRKDTHDELDELGKTIEGLFAKIQIYTNEIKDLNQNLESKVKEKTQIILDQTAAIESSARLTALGEMAGGIAHEINNPIAIIAGTSELMEKMLHQEKFDTKRFLNLVEKISITTQRISALISGMRALSRDSKHEKPTLTTVRELLSDVTDLTAEKFRNEDILFQMSIDPALEEKQFWFHRIQISQVLFNLMINAYDAILQQDRHEARWIRVEISDAAQEIIIRVVDSGPGIPEGIREKIFRPFFTTKPVGKGVGLGLSLSFSLLKRIGGTLELDPTSPHTCFMIHLPKGTHHV